MWINDDVCYQALTARDARFDGQFFVAVVTTGVYCRPVCPARVPRRDNCRFFPSAAAAEAGGYRPCLRCRPELAPGHASVDARPPRSLLGLLPPPPPPLSAAASPFFLAAAPAPLGPSRRGLSRPYCATCAASAGGIKSLRCSEPRVLRVSDMSRLERAF